MTPPLSVSGAARRISAETGVPTAPRQISDLFYQRKLDDETCPVVGRFRIIPESYLSTIKDVLRQQGRLTEAVAETCPE